MISSLLEKEYEKKNKPLKRKAPSSSSLSSSSSSSSSPSSSSSSESESESENTVERERVHFLEKARLKKERADKIQRKLRKEAEAAERRREEEEKQKPPSERDPEAVLRVEAEELTRTLFVGNVPMSASLKEVSQAFSSRFGAVLSVRFRGLPPSVVRGKDGAAKKVPVQMRRSHHSWKAAAAEAAVAGGDGSAEGTKMAYVVFEAAESVSRALAERTLDERRGITLGGKVLRIDRASSRYVEGDPGRSGDVDSKKSVFVGNLELDATEDQVRVHFGRCGPIVNIRISKDRITGRGKGVAFVEFAEKAAVHQALQLNGVPLIARPLKVSKCLERDKAGQMMRKLKEEQRQKSQRRALKEQEKKLTGSKKGTRLLQKVHKKKERENPEAFRGKKASPRDVPRSLLPQKKKGKKKDQKKKFNGKKK